MESKYVDKKVALGIAIMKELAKGRRWVLPKYTIVMAEDYTIGFLLTKENGDEMVGGLDELTLKDIIQIADQYGIEMILPSEPIKAILRRAENMDW